MKTTNDLIAVAREWLPGHIIIRDGLVPCAGFVECRRVDGESSETHTPFARIDASFCVGALQVDLQIDADFNSKIACIARTFGLKQPDLTLCMCQWMRMSEHQTWDDYEYQWMFACVDSTVLKDFDLSDISVHTVFEDHLSGDFHEHTLSLCAQ